MINNAYCRDYNLLVYTGLILHVSLRHHSRDHVGQSTDLDANYN